MHAEEADEAVIEGDPTLLRQRALIVLDNAIKFSASGGSVVIAVRVAAEGATFSVVDEGVGIAAADVGRVFDRFYRAESVRGTTSGAGLGLAIARWIADAHGAQIVLEPAADRGTRVAITFPVQNRQEHPRFTGHEHTAKPTSFSQACRADPACNTNPAKPAARSDRRAQSRQSPRSRAAASAESPARQPTSGVLTQMRLRELSWRQASSGARLLLPTNLARCGPPGGQAEPRG